ncbi:DEKNAAC101487 [Brettanomyces naardenensis]|uniref:Peroxisomal membrane protein PEX14 n=1 Tax=Brettanomyces naardenensis TaxID=13370 RepID=A0A448YI48_BRENA|nr:DEKNAAC101487 [Brettanomyces naardenensis]
MASIREDMVASAVTFLVDGSVSDSPLAKKIEFLQSKGLTDAEVQEAIRRAQVGSTGNTTGVAVHADGPSTSTSPPTIPVKDYLNNNANENHINYPVYYSAPLSPERDWKDYLIMGTATAGLLYGAYQVVRKYVVPKIIPPSKSELEKEKEAVDQEFMRIQSLLDKFEEEQRDFYKKQDERSAKIDETMVEIDNIITKSNEKNLQNEETLKFLKLEVDSIKTSLMKSLEAQKQTIGSELSSLESQIDDLKLELRTLSSGERPSGANFFSKSSSGSSSSVKVPRVLSSASLGSFPLPEKEKEAEKSPVNPDAFSHLNIPPPSSIPSVKEVFGGSGNGKIPAWQLAAMGEGDKSIPDWQRG